MKLKIGIAGAGIGGLAAAALLAQRGHDVTLFDQFDQPGPVGSGLVIQPVGQAVLARIGALTSAGNPVRRMAGFEASSKRPVLDVRYDLIDPKTFGLGIHRAALFQALLTCAQDAGAKLVTGAAVTAVANQLVATAEAHHGPFDLIVDACGAASPVSPLRSRPLPYGAVWGTVDWPETDLPYDELRQCYRRADRMMGVLPLGQVPGARGRKAAIFWSLPADGFPAWQANGLAAWQTEATALWPAFRPFVDQITTPEQMTFAQYSHGTLHRPWGDHLVHIGDSAHRASPQLGQGANMALLDAHALATALDHFPLAEAPRAYGLGRRWHVAIYQAMSAAFTPQYQSDSRWLPVLRDRVLFPLSQTYPVPRILNALVCGTLLPPLGSLP